MPVLSRGHYRRELAAWAFLPVMLGTVEGGIVGVLAKNAFEGVVGQGLLNVAVAVLAAAPAFANVTSFIWSAASSGRHKVRFLVALQVATATMIASIALAPRSSLGLVILMLGVIGARVCWSGVVTVRSTVWGMNYPRSDRARLAGKLAFVQSIILCAVGLGVGAATDWEPSAFRMIYPAGALVGVIGAWIYSGMRVRGHRALLAAESAGRPSGRRGFRPAEVVSVLRSDRRFRLYMFCMFIFGTGNLMLAAPLIAILRERFMLGTFQGIVITSTLSLLFMLASISAWSRILDRVHIVRFRAVHSWAFTSGIAAFLLGAVLGEIWLLYVGAIAKGIAYGGGALAWNLGHHDFAPPERSGEYMGVHVTLTGIRGIIAPVIGIGLYEGLKFIHPDAGPWVLAVCLTLSLTGAVGFALMARAWSGSLGLTSGSGLARPSSREVVAEGGDPLAPEEGGRVR